MSLSLNAPRIVMLSYLFGRQGGGAPRVRLQRASERRGRTCARITFCFVVVVDDVDVVVVAVVAVVAVVVVVVVVVVVSNGVVVAVVVFHCQPARSACTSHPADSKNSTAVHTHARTTHRRTTPYIRKNTTITHARTHAREQLLRVEVGQEAARLRDATGEAEKVLIVAVPVVVVVVVVVVVIVVVVVAAAAVVVGVVVCCRRRRCCC
jgi:hypothetical protein